MVGRMPTVQGFPDPFAPKGRRVAEFINTVLATALFRCWHIILFFAAWSTFITVWNQHHQKKHTIVFQSLLLTVIGTVLGFVISYRTTSSFERYNEGRRYWSQIVMASRGFARTAWFHIPPTIPGDTSEIEQQKARVLVEKKTAINLLEAFAVAVKHYLRGEDGIYYQDLYHLVKFLPAYALPLAIPSKVDVSNSATEASNSDRPPNQVRFSGPGSPGLVKRSPSDPHGSTGNKASPMMPTSPYAREKITDLSGEEKWLYPAQMPPKYSLFDIFPFSLLVKALTRRGKELGGAKAARLRAKTMGNISHNVPLEVSLYLSSYIAALQNRKAIDPPTATNLLMQLNTLVDALTGLERILTTPIPFSYSFHLWVTTVIYCLALPPQLWSQMRWITIPATTIASFIFFGFLVAGEEIENPFGYDKNDLNMDHFTHNIIRQELRAITGLAAPDPSQWAFSPDNDFVFSTHVEVHDRVSPYEWVQRGPTQIQAALAAQSFPESG